MNPTLFELLKFTLPAIILSGVILYVFQEYIEKKKEFSLSEMPDTLSKEKFNMRIQAFERMTIFLERLQPTSLISNVRLPQMTVRELQFALLQQIRAEYDHNAAAQVYLSNDAWNAILDTKENVITIINKASQNLDPNANGIELAKKIMEILDLVGVNNPCEGALMTVRNEAKMYL